MSKYARTWSGGWVNVDRYDMVRMERKIRDENPYKSPPPTQLASGGWVYMVVVSRGDDEVVWLDSEFTDYWSAQRWVDAWLRPVETIQMMDAEQGEDPS